MSDLLFREGHPEQAVFFEAAMERLSTDKRRMAEARGALDASQTQLRDAIANSQGTRFNISGYPHSVATEFSNHGVTTTRWGSRELQEMAGVLLTINGPESHFSGDVRAHSEAGTESGLIFRLDSIVSLEVCPVPVEEQV